MIKHKCEVCGKTFENNLSYSPKCSECYAKSITGYCKMCGKFMGKIESRGGRNPYCRDCYYNIIKKQK